MINLRRIYDKVKAYHLGDESAEDWANPTGDVIAMSYLVYRLVLQVHRLNKLGNQNLDLCPLCAGDTWGRLSDGGSMDFTRRCCSDCGDIRPEPTEEGRRPLASLFLRGEK